MLNCLTNQFYGGAKRIARRGLFFRPRTPATEPQLVLYSEVGGPLRRIGFGPLAAVVRSPQWVPCRRTGHALLGTHGR